MEKTFIMQQRIVITGPESTGKTTLCQKLAEHYHTLWMPEFAREYVEKLDRPYTIDDVLSIGKKQIELEEQFANKTDLLFIDTDLIITKVWLLHVYGTCPAWINKWLKNAPRSLYLVCEPDLPWEFDPVRENPELRNFFMQWYCNEIESYGFSYRFVSGIGETRTKNAIILMDKILNIK